ncbi:MAG TPA: HEAT repeat domain-containing protein, partial [Planctomycetota bacterium]|nr:HEAT repeat domain-containing protein [Planctomycetota bacterium]
MTPWIDRLQDPDPAARREAAAALRRQGPAAADAVPALAEALRGADAELRLEALHALVAIGGRAFSAVAGALAAPDWRL